MSPVSPAVPALLPIAALQGIRGAADPRNELSGGASRHATPHQRRTEDREGGGASRSAGAPPDARLAAQDAIDRLTLWPPRGGRTSFAISVEQIAAAAQARATLSTGEAAAQDHVVITVEGQRYQIPVTGRVPLPKPPPPEPEAAADAREAQDAAQAEATAATTDALSSEPFGDVQAFDGRSSQDESAPGVAPAAQDEASVNRRLQDGLLATEGRNRESSPRLNAGRARQAYAKTLDASSSSTTVDFVRPRANDVFAEKRATEPGAATGAPPPRELRASQAPVVN